MAKAVVFGFKTEFCFNGGSTPSQKNVALHKNGGRGVRILYTSFLVKSTTYNDYLEKCTFYRRISLHLGPFCCDATIKIP